jgi:hypothetical protein
MSDAAADGLRRLEAQIARDLELLRYPERAWVTPRLTADGAHVHDVVIVGGGQGGLATAFGSVPRLVGGVTASLFEEDREAHYASLRAFGLKEF